MCAILNLFARFDVISPHAHSRAAGRVWLSRSLASELRTSKKNGQKSAQGTKGHRGQTLFVPHAKGQ